MMTMMMALESVIAQLSCTSLLFLLEETDDIGFLLVTILVVQITFIAGKVLFASAFSKRWCVPKPVTTSIGHLQKVIYIFACGTRHLATLV